MSTSSLISHAASELVARRKNNQSGAELASKPTSIDESLAIQLAIIEQLDDYVGGWKCCLPLDNGHVIVAPIIKNTIQTESPCQLHAVNGKAEIENEIAFVFSKTLLANEQGYTEEQIIEAIGSYHMALELMQSRFDANYDATYYEKLADSLTNQGMFIGPEITQSAAFNASHLNVLIKQGKKEQSFVGQHPNGGAEKPVFWLVNFLTKRGVTIEKGQVVITGSFDGIKTVDFEQPCHIAYQGLGEYDIIFNEQ